MSETLVIWRPRSNSLLLILGAAAFFALSIWLVLGGVDDSSRHSPASNHFWGWVGAVFSGAVGLKSVLGLARPSHVVLSPAGFQVKELVSKPLIPWGDVDCFFVVQIRSTKSISYNLKPETKTALERVWSAKGFGFGDGHVPTLLEKSPEDMLALLEDWRQRYGS